MANYDYRTRQAVRERLNAKREEKIRKLSGRDQVLAQKIADGKWAELLEELSKDQEQIRRNPSSWYRPEGTGKSACRHQAILDVFVPKAYQESYLFVIDKLNRFPFTNGWGAEPSGQRITVLRS